MLLEVDKISEGIAILILSIIGISLQSLSNFECWLSATPKNIRRALFLYISGLIICEKKATSSKMADKLGYVNHDTLNRLLLNGRRSINKLSIIFINFCMSKTTGYLIIDDFLIDKPYATHIIGVYNDYDHAKDIPRKGMRIVMILWSNGDIRIPIAWAIWHKERKIFLDLNSKGQRRYKHTNECLRYWSCNRQKRKDKL